MSLPLNTDWQGSRGGLASASASVVNRGVGRPDAFVGGGSTMPPVPSPAAASFVAPARVAGVAGASSRDGDVDLLHNRTPVTWRRMWLQYRFSAILVVFTLVAVLFVYHFLSDGDFSFLMVRRVRIAPRTYDGVLPPYLPCGAEPQRTALRVPCACPLLPAPHDACRCRRCPA
ncbi:hypothetical protein EON67_05840 [archaeon]|nr:MAG: hypothetical protein EON67_05840 [archaeon]